jgi:hypothetical protein
MTGVVVVGGRSIRRSPWQPAAKNRGKGNDPVDPAG